MFLSFFFILVCSYFYLTESFLKREKEDMELKRWEMGENMGVNEEGKTMVIRIYYMKITLLSIKK